MTLPASGTITMSNLILEFDNIITTPTRSLTNYYSSDSLGSMVSKTNALNNNIPSSGPISFNNFYGASVASVSAFAGFGTQTRSGSVFSYGGVGAANTQITLTVIANGFFINLLTNVTITKNSGTGSLIFGDSNLADVYRDIFFNTIITSGVSNFTLNIGLLVQGPNLTFLQRDLRCTFIANF